MKRSLSRQRANARQLYLSGEATSNAEIAARLKVKPHTVGKWRREEDWDGLRLKVDKRAAEMFVEKIATDRVSLNLRHYRFWELMLVKLSETLKQSGALDIREMDRVAGILERAQKGQRLAKGLSITGETEEQIRAEAQAGYRRLVDVVMDAIKENVSDEEARERIRQFVLDRVPQTEDERAIEPEDEVA